MISRLLSVAILVPGLAFAAPPAVVSLPALPAPAVSPVPFTPAHTPLVPLTPLVRPAIPAALPVFPVAPAYRDAAAVISLWNASVADPARRVYVHPDAAHFTLTVGGERVLPPSSYQGLWLAAMRPGSRPEDLSLADRSAMKAFAENLAAYRADYRAEWERERGTARPAERPLDPLQAALWDLDARITAINTGANNPRLSPQTNEFLRSVDMHRFFTGLRTSVVGESGDNLAKVLWRHDLSFAPVGQPSPRGIMIFDHRTGRSLSLPDYIAAGFPERIR